jgi:hypothetical protein
VYEDTPSSIQLAAIVFCRENRPKENYSRHDSGRKIESENQKRRDFVITQVFHCRRDRYRRAVCERSVQAPRDELDLASVRCWNKAFMFEESHASVGSARKESDYRFVIVEARHIVNEERNWRNQTRHVAYSTADDVDEQALKLETVGARLLGVLEAVDLSLRLETLE